MHLCYTLVNMAMMNGIITCPQSRGISLLAKI